MNPTSKPLRLLAILLISIALSSCTRIDAGYEGILIKQYGTDKGVQDVALVSGRVTYNPWTEDVEQIPLFVQTQDYEPFSVNAKDGSVFTVDPTISIKVIKGSSPSIYQKYRKEIDEIIQITIYNYVKDAFRIQFNKYTTDDITSKREEFENAVQTYLVQQLEKEGFHLEQLTSGLKYPDIIVKAIDAKNEAVQNAMRIENEVKAAEAQAKIKIAKAKGDADALVIQAKADAEANELRQRSLNTLLIQQQFIEKWDGKLPVYGTPPTIFKNLN
jgi:regulator of protease activity HflC (stomatin/prohibitin superfamily)